MSEYFAEELLLETFGREAESADASVARARMLRDRDATRDRLGPVCGARHVYDLVAAPLAAALGFAEPLVSLSGNPARVTALLGGVRRAVAVLVATQWGEGLDSAWRDAVRAALSASAPWCVCTNGTHVRLIDARRTYARRSLQFDLDLALADERTFGVFWAVLRGRSFHRGPAAGGGQSLIERIVAASDSSTVRVCRSLREGVLAAITELLGAFVAPRRRDEANAARLQDVYQQALTIVYRILFLLFAESRRLVPTWHPLYRDAYSLETARSLAERPRPARGLWEMLQATSRLSHAGCHAGDLRVTPFNGRLFSPAATPLGESSRPGDETARRVLLALSTAPRPGGRARIAYRDLDVEQLGAVYESVLDYVPRIAGGSVALQPCSGLRKETASFYTPRGLTTYLAGRVLSPLVADAAPEQILALRVLDPAMGSGAFLVAACRFLAAAYETSLVRSGRCLASDVDDADRRGFRRAVAQRCLYGVDLNPMAVQLARLSLWLATLSPDHPLTFLDHRLVVGDSLVGTSPDDALGKAPPGTARGRTPGELPLFAGPAIESDFAVVVPRRAVMADRPDDSLDAVHDKERIIASLSAANSPLAKWRAVLDLWCAQAFLPPGDRVVQAGIFGALADHVLTGRSALPGPVVARHLDVARAAIGPLRPLHWPLEFPEAFCRPDGTPLERPGFDAVIGNPPWDAIPSASRLLRFARDSGIYRSQGRGHGNRFQLFVERAFRLARPGGRLGLVVPWGLAADHGCADLRRLLFDRTTIDSLVAFDNSDRIFPIHRSVRFLAFSATKDGRTATVPVRLGVRDPAALDEAGADAAPRPSCQLSFSRRLLERLSGDQLALPDVRRQEDLGLLEKLVHVAPALSSADGWRAEFGRELNASEDSSHFAERPGGLVVLEGKDIDPFRAHPERARRSIPLQSARTLLRTGSFSRPRLAYRDVASATNRLTLIAAIVPAGCVTVHTLFCLRTPLPLLAQSFLCGILNSFVANYFVRFWVTTHVTTAIVSRLPVPRPAAGDAAFRRIARLATHLGRTGDPFADPDYPVLQAAVARAYSLTTIEFESVLATFPLVHESIRGAALAAFDRCMERDTPAGEAW